MLFSALSVVYHGFVPEKCEGQILLETINTYFESLAELLLSLSELKVSMIDPRKG